MIRSASKASEEAKEALESLHSSTTGPAEEAERIQPCVSLCQLTGTFEEIIFGPRSKGEQRCKQ